MGLSLSDWLSIIAFLISIIGFAANSWYTRRTFEASYFPDVRINVKQKTNEGTHLIFEVTNLSGERAVKKGHFTAYIKNYTKKWQFWQNTWLSFMEKSGLEVNPQETKVISQFKIDRGGSLERFLVERFPNLVSENQIANMGLEHFLMNDVSYFQFMIIIQFEPGVRGGRKILQKHRFAIVPHCTGPFNRISHWTIRE